MKTVVIYKFMIKDLKLKGFELLIYALIYSFSQFGQKCFMKPETIADDLGLSRSQVFKCLSSLLSKGYIIRDSGFFVKTLDSVDNDIASNLSDLIRIAKTPWVED